MHKISRCLPTLTWLFGAGLSVTPQSLSQLTARATVSECGGGGALNSTWWSWAKPGPQGQTTIRPPPFCLYFLLSALCCALQPWKRVESGTEKNGVFGTLLFSFSSIIFFKVHPEEIWENQGTWAPVIKSVNTSNEQLWPVLPFPQSDTETDSIFYRPH